MPTITEPVIAGRQLPRAARVRVLPPAWLVYVAGVSLVAGIYLLGSGWMGSGPVFNAIGLSAAVAIVAGVRRNRPRAAPAWYALAVGQVLFVVGDVLAYNYSRFFGGSLPFPSIADPFYLAVYPSVVAGLLLLIRHRTPTRDRASLVDSLIVAVGVGSVSWIYLISPYAHDATLRLPTKLISIAYPVMDLLVLAVAVRLATGAGRRTERSFVFLCLGILALLVTDGIYGWLLLHGGYETGGPLDAGWIAFYVLLGAAALHPSMRRLSEPIRGSEPRVTRLRLGLLGSASLLGPGTELVRIASGQPFDVEVLTSTSIVLFVLVMIRMAGLVRRQEAARQIEAALRKAGETLVASTSRAALHEAAVTAARSLAGGPDLLHARLYLPQPETQTLEAVAATDRPLDRVPPLDVANPGEDARDRWLAPLSAEIVARPDDGAWPDGTQTVCLAPMAVRDELRGVLAVFGNRSPRREVHAALSTLAVEVALALESVARTEENARRRSEARFASLVRHASDVVGILSVDGTVLYISPSVERLLGRAPGDLLGRKLLDVVHDDDRVRSARFLCGLAEGDAVHPGAMEFRTRHANGSIRYVEALATNLISDATVGGIVLNMRDVSDRKAVEQELAHQAFHDTLTGLPNRALFRDRVEHALERQRRRDLPIAVLFVDLDDFKTVNDSFGHAAGDDLLREVGRRMSACIRASDTAGRLGGDEFGVLLEEVPDEVEAAEIAGRVMAALSQPFDRHGVKLFTRVSVGIAVEHDGGRGAAATDELLREADVAMYLAKERGKGRYQVYDPSMHAAALRRIQLKADLQRAITDREFHLVYQPIIALDSRRLSGVEALVRWEHPDRGLVSPAEFIPLAEDTGIIVELGNFSLEEACRQAALLQSACPQDPVLTMSVNLSPRQLQHPRIVDQVREALEASGLPPESLILEITENAMITDTEISIMRLHELRALGVRLAVDDFGTGYSSLNYIRQFPIDTLKIDRSFIRDMMCEPQVAALTRTIVELARILNLQLVAEGIEDPDQLEHLRGLDCKLGQGFYLHRPMDGAAVEQLARAQAGAPSAA